MRDVLLYFTHIASQEYFSVILLSLQIHSSARSHTHTLQKIHFKSLDN